MSNNVNKLLRDMVVKEYAMAGFEFTYNNIATTALVSLKGADAENADVNRHPETAFIEFIKNGQCEGLVGELSKDGVDFVNPNEFYQFWDINSLNTKQDNSYTLWNNFNIFFLDNVPQVIPERTVEIIELINPRINGYDRGRYLNHVQRLPLGQRRSLATVEWTRIHRLEVFERFKDDNTISFYFYQDEDRENTLEQIIRLFGQN